MVLLASTARLQISQDDAKEATRNRKECRSKQAVHDSSLGSGSLDARVPRWLHSRRIMRCVHEAGHGGDVPELLAALVRLALNAEDLGLELLRALLRPLPG